jgi:hypothetical protein
MNKKLSYAITDKNITVNYDGQTHIVSRSEDPTLAEQLLQALRENRQDEIPDLISAATRIESYGQGDFKVVNGEVHINGQPVHSSLAKKILDFHSDKLPHLPLVNFAKNLQRNPSFRAVNELFNFLDKNDHPITEDGKFIAYKKVRPDFKDIHSGTFDNSPGQVVSMPRNQVDEDPTRTCSAGLHVANWTYAHDHFGSPSDVMLEVEVDPADVVSVPVDYDSSKMRVCQYTVLGVVDRQHSSNDRLRSNSSTFSSSHEEDDFKDEEDDFEDEYGDYDDDDYNDFYYTQG